MVGPDDLQLTRTEAFRRVWVRLLADRYRPRYALLADEMAHHALREATARRVAKEMMTATWSMGPVMQIKLLSAREKWANYQN